MLIWCYFSGYVIEDIDTLPLGSTSRDILIASEVARSWLAGETARMIQLGCIIENVELLIFYTGINTRDATNALIKEQMRTIASLK